MKRLAESCTAAPQPFEGHKPSHPAIISCWIEDHVSFGSQLSPGITCPRVSASVSDKESVNQDPCLAQERQTASPAMVSAKAGKGFTAQPSLHGCKAMSCNQAKAAPAGTGNHPCWPPGRLVGLTATAFMRPMQPAAHEGNRNRRQCAPGPLKSGTCVHQCWEMCTCAHTTECSYAAGGGTTYLQSLRKRCRSTHQARSSPCESAALRRLEQVHLSRVQHCTALTCCAGARQSPRKQGLQREAQHCRHIHQQLSALTASQREHFAAPFPPVRTCPCGGVATTGIAFASFRPLDHRSRASAPLLRAGEVRTQGTDRDRHSRLAGGMEIALVLITVATRASACMHAAHASLCRLFRTYLDF